MNNSVPCQSLSLTCEGIIWSSLHSRLQEEPSLVPEQSQCWLEIRSFKGKKLVKYFQSRYMSIRRRKNFPSIKSFPIFIHQNQDQYNISQFYSKSVQFQEIVWVPWERISIFRLTVDTFSYNGDLTGSSDFLQENSLLAGLERTERNSKTNMAGLWLGDFGHFLL